MLKRFLEWFDAAHDWPEVDELLFDEERLFAAILPFPGVTDVEPNPGVEVA